MLPINCQNSQHLQISTTTIVCFVVGLVPEPVITLSVQGACTTVEEEEANVESEWHIIVSPSVPR